VSCILTAAINCRKSRRTAAAVATSGRQQLHWVAATKIACLIELYNNQLQVLLIFRQEIPRTVSIEVKGCRIKFLEHVQVKVDLDFNYRGDLSLQLKAPSGTASPLTRYREMDSFLGKRNLTDWTITTLFHWGEDPTGKWELTIEDFDKRNPSTGYYLLWKSLVTITIV